MGNVVVLLEPMNVETLRSQTQIMEKVGRFWGGDVLISFPQYGPSLKRRYDVDNYNTAELAHVLFSKKTYIMVIWLELIKKVQK